MARHAKLLWITGLALGLLLDLLFWKQSLGINFTLYSITCVAAGFTILWINHQRAAGGTLWLLPFILVFAAIVCIRAEPLTVLLAVVYTLFFMVVLVNTFLGGRWFWYGVFDYVSASFRVFASAVSRPFVFNAEVRKEQVETGNPGSGAKIWPYVRGVLIAVPVLAIFGALLGSADVVFGKELNRLLALFSVENLPEYLFRLGYILVAAFLLVGVFLHASTQSKDEKLIGEDKPLVARLMGFTEAMIVLGSVAILFAAFVIVQFRYFFGGQANIMPAGFTYAEYARRGFGELVVVAFFSLLLILGLGAATRREGSTQRRFFSTLSAVIVGLVAVMLVSAYQRLVLYENAYGFSRLRTYTHAALIWIGLSLVAVLVLEMVRRERAIMAAALIAALGFAITLALLNVDGLIVQQNIQRANKGQELDVAYISSLSTDSVPALVEALESPSSSAAVRDAAGAALYCRVQHTPAAAYGDWRSLTLSRRQADRLMKQVKGELDGYILIDGQWPVKILTPARETYECYPRGMD